MDTRTDREILLGIEQAQIADEEQRALGHRIVYDRVTGMSLNIACCRCDPACLDEHGYMVRRKSA